MTVAVFKRNLLSRITSTGDESELEDQLQLGCNICILFKEFLHSRVKKAVLVGILKKTHSFKFFNAITGSIEILRDQRVEKVHFRIPAMSMANLSKESKEKLIAEVDRDSQQAKLTAFFDQCQDLIFEIEHNQEVAQSSFLNTLQRNSDKLNFAGLLLALIIGLYLFFVLTHEVSEDVMAKTFWGQNTALRKGWVFGIYLAMALGQVTIQGLLLTHFVAGPLAAHRKDKWRNYEAEQDDKAAEEAAANFTASSEFNVRTLPKHEKWKLEIKFTLSQPNLAPRLLFFLMALFGTILHPIFFCIQPLQLVGKSTQLRNVVRSVTKNWRALLLTGVLLVVVVYIFAIVAFYGLWEDTFQHPQEDGFHCRTLIRCFIINISYGMRFGGGIGEALLLRPDWENQTAGTYGRLLFEMLYFVILIVIFLNIVFGIIIDTFAELRDQRRFIETDQTMKCFICGIEASVFDRTTSIGGFRNHTENDHNMWTYLYFMHYLKQKPKSELNGQEGYVWDLIQQRNVGFFPLGKALALEEADVLKAQEEADMVQHIDKLQANITALVCGQPRITPLWGPVVFSTR
eukprot:TRINITY_DN56589_c0_g1_i1.p1 TRINITY_DN56589_c0_g1~~TRINITY_DN56589_c0_g1_i1.p1  ORF type:complete len:579 (+),score=47.73 TRINITY_DN56589_c0_g1_i1:24-1739(+)